MLVGGSAPELAEDINPSGCCPCRGPAGGAQDPSGVTQHGPASAVPSPSPVPPCTTTPSPRSWEGAAGWAEPPGEQQGADHPHTPQDRVPGGGTSPNTATLT